MVKPNITLVNSTIILLNNTEKKEQIRYQSISNNVDQSKPYAKFSSATNITKMAQVMIENQLNLSSKYQNLKISWNEWSCRRELDNHEYTVRHVHPRFVRIHKVTYKHCQLLYSCSYSATYGLLCCHMVNVARSLDPTYEITMIYHASGGVIIIKKNMSNTLIR